MRILYVITGLGLGGAEKVVCDLADQMVLKGHEVKIAYLTGDRLVIPRSPNVEIIYLALNGIKSFMCDSNNFKYFIYYIFLYKSTFSTGYIPIVKRKSFNLSNIIAGSSVSSSLKISKSFNNSILEVSANNFHTSNIGSP